MATRDLGSISDLRTLRLLFDASVGSQKTIAEATQFTIDDVYQRRILDSLWSRRIDDRIEGIFDALYKTVRWALEPPEMSHSCMTFATGFMPTLGFTGSRVKLAVVNRP